MPSAKPNNRLVSWVMGLPSFFTLLRVLEADSTLDVAGGLVIGVSGLVIALAVRKPMSWAKMAYALWASILVGRLLTEDIRVEPDVSKIALGFILYAGFFVLLGFRIRTPGQAL